MGQSNRPDRNQLGEDEMLRLELTAEPRWLDLGHGIRLRVAPRATALMAAARSDPAIEAPPDTASDEKQALVFAKAIRCPPPVLIHAYDRLCID
jgi:hypothetical protein